MAVSTSSKSGDDSKADDKSSSKSVWPFGWGPADAKTLKEGMNDVKDEFIKKAKEILKHEYPGYEPTDTGIILNLMGGQQMIGLVKLSKPDMLGGYYASIRVARAVGLATGSGPWGLTGFLIDSKPFLNFVNDGQYGDMFIHNTDWKPVEGKEKIELLKQAMGQVKETFFKKSKDDLGFNFSEYNPTDNGIYYFDNTSKNVIGLVKLSKENVLGGYYASIRVSLLPIIPNPIFLLQGFLIDSRPFLNFVNSGQYGIVTRENSLNEIKDNIKKTNKDKNISIGTNYFHIGTITRADISFVQELVNKVKDEIKQKCGINYELKEFKVVSAASSYTGVKSR